MGEEVFIDANIFLEIFLENEKADNCEFYLKSSAGKNQTITTTDFIIHSCLLTILRKTNSLELARNALVFFSNLYQLKIIVPSIDDLSNALDLMGQRNLDLDDSLVVACMNGHGITELASLDRHFDKVKGIKRIEL
ncbi:type II toxin-antitoxin system VapC family toxin [Candidatus Woesearchaeota archaeon]|nr:type II toxin-antitoxin system VapC family toxin [Candidatus Woesearchaeota archaeon]